MVLVAVRDIAFRSKIHAAAERLGITLHLAPRSVPLSESAREPGVGTLLADLSEPGVLDEVRRAKSAGGPRVVGFLGHLQTELAAAAKEAGVDEVLSRGEVVRRLPEILRAAAEGRP